MAWRLYLQVLTNSGAVPPLVVLLDSPNEEVGCDFRKGGGGIVHGLRRRL